MQKWYYVTSLTSLDNILLFWFGLVDSTLDSKDKGVEDQDNKEKKYIFLYYDVQAICE